MARPAPAADLEVYRPTLAMWMPQAELAAPAEPLPHFDGLLSLRLDGKTIRYLVEERRHFRHLDAAIVAEQLTRWRAALPQTYAGARILLLAPHVREQQGALLERAGIDYIDLAGNAHIDAPGHFVHVQGRRPPTARAAAPARPHKGWVKTVMALLVRSDLVNAPYRAVANEADVALGTVAKCLNDLTLRGLLRSQKGARTLPDRPGLVALWVQAYLEALRPNLAERRFQVRVDDKPQLWERLQRVADQRWALTGADAAGLRSHYFRTDETEIYAPIRLFDARDVQKALLAQPAARAGNLVVIEPPGPLAMPALEGAAVPAAPDLLAYAELRYRGTGQALEAAELLLPRVLRDAAA